MKMRESCKFQLESALTISCLIQANGFYSHEAESTFTVIFRLGKLICHSLGVRPGPPDPIEYCIHS